MTLSYLSITISISCVETDCSNAISISLIRTQFVPHTHTHNYYSTCSHFDWILLRAMGTTIQFARQSTDSIADWNFRFHYNNQRIRKISIFLSLSNSGKWLNEIWKEKNWLKFMILFLRTNGWCEWWKKWLYFQQYYLQLIRVRTFFMNLIIEILSHPGQLVLGWTIHHRRW